MTTSSTSQKLDNALFEQLQLKIDEDSDLRQKLHDIINAWEKQQRQTISILSRVHSTPAAELSPILEEAKTSLQAHVESIEKLKQESSNHPYWKHNGMWTREIQTTCFLFILHQWLATGKLTSIEDCGAAFKVPVNLKQEDAFHITIEEYLHALVSLIEELARLAVNAVTLGDFHRPLQISIFVKDLHAGFQMLNLKNDSLRRRVDSIKYNVKKIEDVVYDLSLRGLIPREEGKS